MPTVSQKPYRQGWARLVFTWENVQSYVSPSLLGVNEKIIVARSRLPWFELRHGDQAVPVSGLQLETNVEMSAVAPGDSKSCHLVPVWVTLE